MTDRQREARARLSKFRPPNMKARARMARSHAKIRGGALPGGSAGAIVGVAKAIASKVAPAAPKVVQSPFTRRALAGKLPAKDLTKFGGRVGGMPGQMIRSGGMANASDTINRAMKKSPRRIGLASTKGRSRGGTARHQ